MWVGRAAATVWKATKKADQWRLVIIGALILVVIACVLQSTLESTMRNRYRFVKTAAGDVQFEPAPALLPATNKH